MRVATQSALLGLDSESVFEGAEDNRKDRGRKEGVGLIQWVSGTPTFMAQNVREGG